MTWDAFISYSHAADGKLAPGLQSGLQRFMRPWYRRRALRIFRDETGLTVNPRLWGSIAAALDQSRFFILLASPDAARSAWVQREIQHWLSGASVDRLLPVVTGGDWIWNAADGDFDWQRSTAVPPALKGVFDDEPRHLDLRWARESAGLDLRNPQFLDAIAELAAPLYGKAKDELVGEDVRLSRRARRLAGGAVSGLAALTVAAVVAAVVAEQRRIEAEAQRLAVQSRQISGQPDLAFLLAASAYELLPDSETTGAVFAALQAVPELSRMMRHHSVPVTRVAVLPARDVIVSGDVDGHVIAASRGGSAVLARYDHPLQAAVTCLLPDPDGNTLRLATTGGLLSLGLPDLQPQRAELPSPETLIRCARDPKRPRMTLAGMTGALLVWDLEQHRLGPLPGAEDATAYALAYSADGRYFASGGGKGSVSLRAAVDGRLLWSVPGSDRGDIHALAFRPDGQELLAGDSDGWIRTWRVQDGSSDPGRSRRAHAGSVWDVGYTRGHPNGEYIGSVGTDGEIAWVELNSFLPYSPTQVHLGRVNALDFAEDGTYATAGEDGVVVYFDPRRSPILAGRERRLGRPISALAPGCGKVAVATGAEGMIQVYDLSSLRPAAAPLAVGSVVVAAAYQPVGGSLALGTADGGILVWPHDGDRATASDAHHGPVTALAWSPDGARLYSIGDDRQLRLWPVAGGQLKQATSLDDLASKAMALSPAGEWLAYGHLEDGIRIVATGSGRLLARLNAGRGMAVASLAFHPVKPLLFAGDVYGFLSVWDTRDWTLQQGPTRGHQGEITAIAASPDDDRIFTAGRDGSLRLWSAETGETSGVPILGHSGAIRGLAYDPATRQLVSGATDGRLVLRSMAVERWIVEGCSMFQRNLRPGDYARFHLRTGEARPCRGLSSAVAGD